MKKICHMTSAHGEEDNRIFHKECVSLAESGYDVYLVQRGDSYINNRVHIVGAGNISSKRLARMILGAYKVYRRAIVLNCDLYHIHDPELLPYALILKHKGKRVIFDSHELYREQLKHKGRIGPFVSQIYSVFEKIVFQRIDGLIFPCPINGENPFEGMYNDFAYVNNVPRLSELYSQYDETAKKYKNSICYIGAISESRGVTNLIKAAAISDSTLYLAGPCHNEEYFKNIQNMPEYSHVEYLGVLNRAQIVDLLKHVKIGMATLLNVGQYDLVNNLPTKVYEYMSMGIPSIISQTSYNAEINKKYQFGILVNPNDHFAIADAIQRLNKDTQMYYTLSINARNAIGRYLNWEIECHNLLQLYQRIMF